MASKNAFVQIKGVGDKAPIFNIPQNPSYGISVEEKETMAHKSDREVIKITLAALALSTLVELLAVF